MHKFPKDANLKRQWVKFVQVKRADFVRPTEHSVICNVHFTPDCYEKRFMVEMGLKKPKAVDSWCSANGSVSSSKQLFRRTKAGYTK